MPLKIDTPRARLLQLAKLVAGDIRRREASPGLPSIGRALTENPDTVMTVLDLLRAERRKKRPNDGLCDAFVFMIEQALTEARMAMESNADGTAARLVAEVRGVLIAAAKAGEVSPDLLIALAQSFAAAKLDLGDELRDLTAALSEQDARHRVPPGPEEVTAHYAALARTLDDEPFRIHEQLSEQLSAFPVEQRAVIVGSLATSEVPAMREAALGWLLDPSSAVTRSVAQNLAATAAQGLVSAQSADRLVLMRPWLPEAVQGHLDAAVRACRHRGTGRVDQPAVQVNAVIASGCDGAGAQSVLILLKRGRKLALASLLVKQGFGVRDAWVREDMSRREVDDLLFAIGRELDAFDASLESVQSILTHALAVGRDEGDPPPFGLVQFLEAVGVKQIRPQRIDGGTLIAELLDGAPAERRSEKAVRAALAASKRWPTTYAFAQSWLEQDAAAHAAVSGASGKRQQQTAVLEQVLPTRRARWAELLAWTAKAAQDQVEGDAWIDFALVARELASDRPLSEIPVAAWIAGNTAAALSGR